MVPQTLARILLKLGHDELGHNGTVRICTCCSIEIITGEVLNQDVVRYVKQCELCRKHNSASPHYIKGTFDVPQAPMDFISMDLIRELHPPSTQGNKYALP